MSSSTCKLLRKIAREATKDEPFNFKLAYKTLKKMYRDGLISL